MVNPVANDKILDLSELKAFVGNKMNVAKIMIYVSDRSRKLCGKRRQCRLPAFSSFPTKFSKGFFLKGVKVGIVIQYLIEAMCKDWIPFLSMVSQ